MDAWESAYQAYRQFINQSLAVGAEVLVVSPDNDDLPPEECTRPVVVGTYDQID